MSTRTLVSTLQVRGWVHAMYGGIGVHAMYGMDSRGRNEVRCDAHRTYCTSSVRTTLQLYTTHYTLFNDKVHQ